MCAEGAMCALMIREDVPPGEHRRLGKAWGDLRVARRLLVLAAALEGMSREAAARMRGWTAGRFGIG
jgi:hypothetical protein